MDLYFVLVEPAVPENIGAAARAINTMGFRKLRLVKSNNHLADEARWLAHGSIEILEKAEVFSDFQAAINDLDFVIGTTAKSRSAKHDYYSPEQARHLVTKKGASIEKVGIVFGREESGLKNEELAQCDIASTIPLSNPYPSINLAQSVMLYSYVFSSLKVPDPEPMNPADQRIYKELKLHATRIMEQLDMKRDTVLFHRILERLATANEDDARSFLSFAKNFKHKFE